jgi:hypothetical protein
MRNIADVRHERFLVVHQEAVMPISKTTILAVLTASVLAAISAATKVASARESAGGIWTNSSLPSAPLL